MAEDREGALRGTLGVERKPCGQQSQEEEEEERKEEEVEGEKEEEKEQ